MKEDKIKIVIWVLAGAFATSAVLYLKNRQTVERKEVTEDSEIATPALVSQAVSATAAVSNTATTASMTAVNSRSVTELRIEKQKEKLLNNGYTQDPQNPLRFNKIKTDKYGRQKMSYVEIDPYQTEVKMIDVSYAEELLARKQSEDPVQEMATMSEMDDNYGQSSMLSGKFRDESADIEISISTAYEADTQNKAGFPVCLVAKKNKIDFISMGYPVKANEEGYGLVDFKNGYFLRAMSVFEPNGQRLLIGQILFKQNGQFQLVQKIRASAVNTSEGGKLKYCDGRQYGS